VIPVGQKLLTGATVLDPHDAGICELTHRAVNRVDRAAQAPGQSRPGRHTTTRAVAVAQQKRVKTECAIGDGSVDHPFRDDREPWFFDEEGAGGVVVGFWWWGFSGHGMTSRLFEVRWAWLARPLALKGASASGMRQEMRRNCTDGPVSGVRTGIALKDVRAGQDLFRPIPAQGGYGPDCLRIRRLGVRIPSGALRVETETRVPKAL